MADREHPPRPARWLLERAIPPGAARDGLVGDLHELYLERRRTRGRLRADFWYCREAFAAASRYALRRIRTGGRTDPASGAARGGEGRRGEAGWMRSVWVQLGPELRQGLRRLIRNPGFTAASIIPLALGLGAATTIFGLVHHVVLSPLPYPEADRLVVVRHLLPGYEVDGRVPRVGAFLGQYLHYRERSRLLSEIGAYWTFDGTLLGDEGPEYVRLGGATAGLWRALGVRPVEGRLFRDDEPWPAGTGRGVTLLSHESWTRRYGSESAVGSTVATSGWSFEIVGVLPPSLLFARTRPVMWNSIPDEQAGHNPEWTVPALVGRLAPGATAESLQRELTALVRELPERYQSRTIRNTVERGGMTPTVVPLADWVLGDAARSIWLLFASVLLLLLVAFANVGGLFLVRTNAVRRELALRLALGSGRRGVVLRATVEVVLLTGAAALLALALAHLGVEAVARRVPAGVPRIESVAVGPGEVAFLLGIALLATGTLTAIQLLHSRRGATGILHKEGRRGATAGTPRPRLRLRHAFVTLQVAAALVLLVGAGLVFRSARSLGDVNPGFPVEGVLTFRVPFPISEIQAADARGTTSTPFFQELTRRLEALPGVERVGWGSCVPLSRVCSSGGFAVRTPEGEASDEEPAASAVFVSPGFRPALGIPLLEGRDLEADDHRKMTNRVLVSRTLARRLWPGESPLERTLTPVAFGQSEDPQPFTVAGVVDDIRFDNLRRDAGAMVYMPVLVTDRARDISMANFVVRTSVPPLSLVDAVRRTVSELRGDIPVASVETMSASLTRETATLRFSSLLLGLAAAATVLLSALGVYAVIAYVVGLRRAEFGIRMAMGARGTELRRMVLMQGLVTVGAGVALGLLGAMAASGLVRSLLFGVAPDDPVTYTAASALLVLAAVAATYLPARRASRVDPAEALRAD